MVPSTFFVVFFFGLFCFGSGCGFGFGSVLGSGSGSGALRNGLNSLHLLFYIGMSGGIAVGHCNGNREKGYRIRERG